MIYYIHKSEPVYIMHHGIKGQKWGQRNGPPYPIGSDGHSIREEKADWRSSLDKTAYKQAKKNKRKARREYNDAYNAAYNYSSMHPISSSIKGTKNNKKATELWNKQREAQTSYDEAVKKLKIARQDYKTQKAEINTKNLVNILGISENEAEHIKKYAKIVGISLATTAGLVAAGYLISRNRTLLRDLGKSFTKALTNKNGSMSIGEEAQKIIGFNRSGANHTYKLSSSGLFKNTKSVGELAKLHGYGEIDAKFIENAIANPKVLGNKHIESLARDVRLAQIDILDNSCRRLSCWSTAESYFMSRLTGREFCSKSFENLVDFNDFGTLYKKQPKIFDISGKEALDFVGKFGRGENRVKMNQEYGERLVHSIFDNIGKSNNLTPDGKSTLGFINAAYRGSSCTHQWNFEILHKSGGDSILRIIDGYGVGTNNGVEPLIIEVATRSSNGKLTTSSNFARFMEELYHYNADSVRFYAPSLDSIDATNMARVILGKR